MASVAPASCSFWAMPQAMERLLASPKTTAVLPAKLIMLCRFLRNSGSKGKTAEPPPCVRISERISAPELRSPQCATAVSAAEVDQFNMSHRPAQELRPQPFEFLHGIG